TERARLTAQPSGANRLPAARVEQPEGRRIVSCAERARKYGARVRQQCRSNGAVVTHDGAESVTGVCAMRR
ncbi:hypothetical protein KC219_22745, partial [Mycobacterium tuberculosis]|nr:hypothetical protein [Mycobacterium tuberculosis]